MKLRGVLFSAFAAVTLLSWHSTARANSIHEESMYQFQAACIQYIYAPPEVLRECAVNYWWPRYQSLQQTANQHHMYIGFNCPYPEYSAACADAHSNYNAYLIAAAEAFLQWSYWNSYQ